MIDKEVSNSDRRFILKVLLAGVGAVGGLSILASEVGRALQEKKASHELLRRFITLREMEAASLEYYRTAFQNILEDLLYPLPSEAEEVTVGLTTLGSRRVEVVRRENELRLQTILANSQLERVFPTPLQKNNVNLPNIFWQVYETLPVTNSVLYIKVRLKSVGVSFDVEELIRVLEHASYPTSVLESLRAIDPTRIYAVGKNAVTLVHFLPHKKAILAKNNFDPMNMSVPAGGRRVATIELSRTQTFTPGRGVLWVQLLEKTEDIVRLDLTVERTRTSLISQMGIQRLPEALYALYTHINSSFIV